MEVIVGRTEDFSGDGLTCPLLDTKIENTEAEKIVQQQPGSPDADSGRYSDDEKDWEEIRGSSNEVEVVPQENETLVSVEKKIQSILRAEPQVFTVNETMKKQKNNKGAAMRIKETKYSKSVVFHLPEGMAIPEKGANKKGSRAKKTLLVLRKKLTGEKEEIPWRTSTHCSPRIAAKRTKKLPKDYYFQFQQEVFVRPEDLSDEEGEDTVQESVDGADTSGDSESTTSPAQPAETGELLTAEKSSKTEDDEDEELKLTRRKEFRMQLHAMHLHYQMNPKSLKKTPAFRTGGHGLGHSNPKTALTRSQKTEHFERKISDDHQMTPSPQSARKISPASPSTTPKMGPVRKISGEHTNEATAQRVKKTSKDNTAAKSKKKFLALRKISRDNVPSETTVQLVPSSGKDKSLRKISNENTPPELSSDPSGSDIVPKQQPRKSSKVYPFKYINTKLALKLAQHFSGSESEGERSRSSSRHNSVSMSDDSITSILDKVVPPPPRSTKADSPGKIVRTRYRKISREEAMPYPREVNEDPFQET